MKKSIKVVLLVSILGLTGCPSESEDTALQIVNNSSIDVQYLFMKECAATTLPNTNHLPDTLITGKTVTIGGLAPDCYDLQIQAYDNNGYRVGIWTELEVIIDNGQTRIWTLYPSSDTIQSVSPIEEAKAMSKQSTNSSDLGTSTLGTIFIDRGVD